MRMLKQYMQLAVMVVPISLPAANCFSKTETPALYLDQRTSPHKHYIDADTDGDIDIYCLDHDQRDKNMDCVYIFSRLEFEWNKAKILARVNKYLVKNSEEAKRIESQFRNAKAALQKREKGIYWQKFYSEPNK